MKLNCIFFHGTVAWEILCVFDGKLYCVNFNIYTDRLLNEFELSWIIYVIFRDYLKILE